MSDPRPELFPGSCFSDGKRKIDFVVVCSRLSRSNEFEEQITTFERNLEQLGLRFESSAGMADPDLWFTKIHGPDAVLLKYADENNIPLSCDNPYYKKEREGWWGLLDTPLTRSSKLGADLYARAKFTFSGEQPKTLTDSERIYIVYNLLQTVKYTAQEGKVGISNMQEDKFILDAYAIHETDYHWPEEGPVSDRQLLMRYWASYWCFFKRQPYSLIQRYLGPQGGFYFAWAGYLSYMLWPFAVFSLVCFVVGVIHLIYNVDVIEKEVCESDKVLCPTCSSRKECEFTLLRNVCSTTKMSYVVDNPFVFLTSMVVSLWGLAFLALWRRREAMLMLRWDLTMIQVSRKPRPEFMAANPEVRQSSLTSGEDIYVPKWKLIRMHCISFVVFLLLLVMHLFFLFFIDNVVKFIDYRGITSMNKAVRQEIHMIAIFVYGFLVGFLISIVCSTHFGILMRVSTMLTEGQLVRTNIQFQNRMIVKSFMLVMIGYLTTPFYLGLIKGNFYFHPGFTMERSWLQILVIEQCKPPGCFVELSALLISVLVTNPLKDAIKTLIKMYFTKWMKFVCLKRGMKERPNVSEDLPQYQKDYYLMESKNTRFLSLHMTLAVRYMLMVCFMSAFSPMPIAMLFICLLEIRKEAIITLKFNRRQVPAYVPGLGAWNTVLQGVTYLGVLTNAAIMAFTSSTIPYLLYYFRKGDVHGFIDSKLSLFAVKDLNMELKAGPYENLTACYYLSVRHPPDHEKRYQYTGSHWNEITIRCFGFITIENVTIMASLLLLYAIPRYPRKIKLLMEDNYIKLRKLKKASKK